MADFYDKPVVEQRLMVDRPTSVQELFDAERRGQKAHFKSDVMADLAGHVSDFDHAWSQNFLKLKDSLRAQSEDSTAPSKKAQLEVMAQQLDDLNAMKPSDRIALFKSFKDNTAIMVQAQSASDQVQNAMRAGYLPAAEREQREVVRLVSTLDGRATKSVIDSTVKVRNKEKDPAIRAALEDSLADTRTLLAAPFIERSRLAAILVNNKKPYQAETALAEALKAAVSDDAWLLPGNKKLHDDAVEQSRQLHVQNNLTEIFDRNIDRLDANHDHSVDDKELAAAMGRGDQTEAALTKFLTANYDYLTRHHWPIISRPGISRDDVQRYVQERQKDINDLPLK